MPHYPRSIKGFSLIELMIVVAILGTLSSIAVPAFTDYTQRTKATTAYLSLQPWQTAVALCWQEKGSLTGCGQLGTAGIPPVPTQLPEGLTRLSAGSTNGSLRAKLDAFDSEGKSIEIELQPVPQATQLTWQVLCSDYSQGARIKKCSGILPSQGSSNAAHI